MAWCLYEAMRDDERNFLRRADCMSVLQDSRGNDVFTRYVASGGGPRKLEVRTGILQLQVGRAAGAVDLQRALLRSLRSMATKRKPHGNMYRTREKKTKRPATRLFWTTCGLSARSTPRTLLRTSNSQARCSAPVRGGRDAKRSFPTYDS